MNMNQELINQNQEINCSSASSISELLPRQDEIINPQKDSKIKMKSVPAKILLKTIYKYQRNNHFDQQVQSFSSYSNNTLINNVGIDKILKESKLSVKSQNQKNQKNSISFDFQSQKKQQQSQMQQESRVSQQKSRVSQQKLRVNSNSNKQKQEQIQNYIQQIRILKKQTENHRNQNVNTIKKNQRQKQMENVRSLLSDLQKKKEKITELQRIIDTQTQLNQIQKKANQIYTHFHHDLVKLLTSRNQKYKQSELSMDQILKVISQMIEIEKHENVVLNHGNYSKNQNSENQTLIKKKYQARVEQLNLIISNCDDKISQLRSQLVKSTQNNINAIFNTQISASSCLQHEILKINRELSSLKMNIHEVSYQSKQNLPNIIKIQPQVLQQKQPKVIKIYNNFHQGDNASDSEEIKQFREQKAKRKNKKKFKKVKQISSQQENQSNQQKFNKKTIQQIKKSYNQIKQQYGNLFKTLKIISQDQQNHKKQLQIFNAQLLNSIKAHFQQVNLKNQRETAIKHQQERQSDMNIINHLNIKFIELMSAISIPQIIQREVGQDQAQTYPYSQISLSVQYIRQMQKLKNQNTQLYQQLKQLQKQNNYLKEQISLINYQSKAQINQRKQSFIYQLKDLTSKQINSERNLINQPESNLQKVNKFYKSSNLLNRHMQINTQSYNTNQNNIFYNKSIPLQLTQTNKNNYKIVLKDKNDQIKILTQQLFYQQKIIRQKQSRIHQLQILFQNSRNRNMPTNYQNISKNYQSAPINYQNAPIDHQNINKNYQINSRNFQNIKNNHENYQNNIISAVQFDDSNSIAYSNQGLTQQKYQAYIKNLKLLLKDARRQNTDLKMQLNQFLNEQQVDCRTETIDILKNSAAQSDRTAKNYPSNSSPSMKKGGQIAIKRRLQQHKIDEPFIFQRQNNSVDQSQILLCVETIIQVLNEIQQIKDKQSIRKIIAKFLKNLEQKNTLIWRNIYDNISVQNLINLVKLN